MKMSLVASEKRRFEDLPEVFHQINPDYLGFVKTK